LPEIQATAPSNLAALTSAATIFKTDLLRFRRRRGWIGLLELALLLLFLLGLLFQVSFPLFELIVWFWQFVILFLV
jgi:hypothetical protein